jgi:2,4-dienoyl-CoA reductase-like NADH-dependent reductase (Old Yellow Enzyme family)
MRTASGALIARPDKLLLYVPLISEPVSMTEAHLFSPFKTTRGTLKNRIAVSPMCQYSSVDGVATDWHLVHLGSRAVGGAGLVMVEATAVEPRGRISPEDMGIWDKKHVEAFKPIAKFIHEQGAVAGIQLAHAGRKASTLRMWEGNGPVTDDRKWEVVGPSAIPFDTGWNMPEALTEEGINDIKQKFVDATKRALSAGFRLIEIHAAHGYLLHSFLSPISNKRDDKYGGSLENRMRFLLETVEAVGGALAADTILFVRLSCTDWIEGGWDIEQSVVLSRELKKLGVDLIDCSSGAIAPHVRYPTGPGYQVPFAERIKKDVGIATGAVGMITEAKQANEIITSGKADIVLLARQELRDPYWPLHAAKELGVDVPWPVQYERAAK